MRNFILFISLFLSLSLFSQSENGERVLSAKCAIQQTMGGAGYWQVSITNFSDPGGQVDATAIDTLDYIQFSDSGTPYALQVVGVISAVGNTATVKLSNVGITGISSVPTTSNATWSRRTENFGLTPWPANITGNDAQLNQEYTMYKIDSILGTFSAGSDIDYVTTDSFTTFIGGYTFASIPINKTVWRTTTGSKFQKTSSTAMTRRSTDNGLNASTIANTSNDSIQFNSNLNNRVQMTTGNVSTAYVLDPLYYTSQAVGETFVIGIQAGSSDVTVNWSSVFGIYTGTTFSTMPTTIVPNQSVMTFTFRVITTSSEVTKFHYVDGISGNSGVNNCISQTVAKSSHGFTLGQPVAWRGGTIVGAGINALIPAEAIVTQIVNSNSVVISYAGECNASSHGFTVDSSYYTPRLAGSPIINASRPDTIQFLFRPSTTGKLIINVGEMFLEGGAGGGSSNGMQPVQTISSTGAPTITSGYTLIPIKATSASGAVDVQINPATTGVNYRIVATNVANTLRVVPTSGTISGSSSYVFSVVNESISITSDGTNLFLW